jgi:hypothetical protein
VESAEGLLAAEALQGEGVANAREASLPQTKEDLEDAIIVLDPAYLEAFKDGKKRQDIFFQEVLPVLATRFDHSKPSSPASPENISSLLPQLPSTPRLDMFTVPCVDISKIRDVYVLAPLKYIAQLHRFVVFKRAQMMYDKLWRHHAEFYFLGHAHGALRKLHGVHKGGESITWKRQELQDPDRDSALALMAGSRINNDGRKVKESSEMFWEALGALESRLRKRPQ